MAKKPKIGRIATTLPRGPKCFQKSRRRKIEKKAAGTGRKKKS